MRKGTTDGMLGERGATVLAPVEGGPLTLYVDVSMEG